MTVRLVLLGAVVTAGGCGTAANLADHQQIYGGTSIDHACLLHAYNEFTHPHDAHQFTDEQDATVMLMSCADLPISAIADTFTLPITCYHWLKDRNKQPEAGAAAVAVQTNGTSPVASSPVTAGDTSLDRAPTAATSSSAPHH